MRRLRSGYTTGACAAAAAKASAMLLIMGPDSTISVQEVEIPFPDGGRVKFKVHSAEMTAHDQNATARASVLKDAGDDPDVTNGIEIVAEARVGGSGMGDPFDSAPFDSAQGRQDRQDKQDRQGSEKGCTSSILIKGGRGIGVATKPGLAVAVGEPAINPVPRKMIKEAVSEAIQEFKSSRVLGPDCGLSSDSTLEITISVPEGERLARKTLNARLGIIGGISILGTTGIVKPISSEAWTATITASMDVAKAMARDEIVLSAGRASEKAHAERFNLPEESYVMMGDYVEFSFLEAERHEFKKIHLCAQWAKVLKIAMATAQTHVKHGAIDLKKAVEFLSGLGIEVPKETGFNTAREIFNHINSGTRSAHPAFAAVCDAAKRYAQESASETPVIAHLVSYEGKIIAGSE